MILQVSEVSTIVFWVLCDAYVQEGGSEPLQCNGNISDGMEHNLCIHVLNQIAMQAWGETDREKMKKEREAEGGGKEHNLGWTIMSVVCCGILTCSQ